MPAEMILERSFNKRSFQKETVAGCLGVGTDQEAGQVGVAAAGGQGLSDLLHRVQQVQLPRPGRERASRIGHLRLCRAVNATSRNFMAQGGLTIRAMSLEK